MLKIFCKDSTMSYIKKKKSHLNLLFLSLHFVLLKKTEVPKQFLLHVFLHKDSTEHSFLTTETTTAKEPTLKHYKSKILLLKTFLQTYHLDKNINISGQIVIFW